MLELLPYKDHLDKPSNTATINIIVNELIRLLNSDTNNFNKIWVQQLHLLIEEKAPEFRDDYVQFIEEKANIENKNYLERSLLANLTVCEISVVYEALLAYCDRSSRKSNGQFFTPDDVAHLMASQLKHFEENKIWLDPCCGIGNLSWHLVKQASNSHEFVENFLILNDLDKTALITAVSLIVASFVDKNKINHNPFQKLYDKSFRSDFLKTSNEIEYDYVIMNPPYAKMNVGIDGFKTKNTKELYAHFIDKVCHKAEGVIMVTPSSFLSSQKYNQVREILNNSFNGGNIFTFDNMPDTLFRGFKYGSTNTAVKNSVRAAITVAGGELDDWKVSPIIRWTTTNREKMIDTICHNSDSLLSPRVIHNSGEWVKIFPQFLSTWEKFFMNSSNTVKSLTVDYRTNFYLTVAASPRYFISASLKNLQRSSKHTLYFPDEESMNKAYLTINSSIIYIWWRALDGGITLSQNTLLSCPVVEIYDNSNEYQLLIEELKSSEKINLVEIKNAGKMNENIKHSFDLVMKINKFIGLTSNKEPEKVLKMFYANDIFVN